LPERLVRGRKPHADGLDVLAGDLGERFTRDDLTDHRFFTLTPRQRKILEWFYALNGRVRRTLTEIADDLFDWDLRHGARNGTSSGAKRSRPKKTGPITASNISKSISRVRTHLANYSDGIEWLLKDLGISLDTLKRNFGNLTLLEAEVIVRVYGIGGQRAQSEAAIASELNRRGLRTQRGARLTKKRIPGILFGGGLRLKGRKRARFAKPLRNIQTVRSDQLRRALDVLRAKDTEHNPLILPFQRILRLPIHAGLNGRDDGADAFSQIHTEISRAGAPRHSTGATRSSTVISPLGPASLCSAERPSGTG